MIVLIHVATHLVTGLLAGAFLLGSTGLRRAMDRLPDLLQVRVRQEVIRPFRQLLLPLMLGSIAATGAMVWIESRSWAAWIAFGLAGAMLAMTIAVNVPVNNMILEWTPGAPPDNWREHLARWNYSDAVRLVMSITAFICTELA
jgi:uncharacterized membrane protein